ncbi:pyrophosphate-fructose 6-phosphate 1-phosphotransferase subunit beta [Micractinium conductrix]|uniref:Pyrophosphate--fructose 6-phosphate 1-phosphotransferase subunit beta n=1 Tax=Micractinium conductrix TaxID=554055 RepID=A0A2P6VBR8_9CHLO|nr:pyrophosphate-fructose 6-phosphate 1-phosphotransferase subunit beta [Micractinium conductrix]|eukprot:PSC71535.1 pyrophosphate-fructose 6-phosphate 1-phosphotransferase subunit beta [Micractinium conductrix]
MVGVLQSNGELYRLPSKPQKYTPGGDGGTGLSHVCLERLAYVPTLPEVLRGRHEIVEGDRRECVGGHDIICGLFPHLSNTHNGHAPLRMVQVVSAAATPNNGSAAERPLRLGVVLSGGQAPGGHNVIIGLHDYLQRWHPGSTLVGFLNGPRGVMQNNYKLLQADELDGYRNQGGFHMIGSGRDAIAKPDQLAAAAKTCMEHDLDGLVVIGGDDSNTNSATMAEHFLKNGVKTTVVGVPKTIDGDLKNADVPTSFGFDTACKVYSEMIGNIMIDAMSAKKYYHFIRLMGRAASHVTLECALQTHPQLAVICEEVAAHRWGLKDVVRQVADMVAQRAELGKNFGVVLVPEGLVEFMHDVSALIVELNEIMAMGVNANDQLDVTAHLTAESADLFNNLPPGIRSELLEERDPHGNVQVSHIQTEKLLIKLVGMELMRRKAQGTFRGKFSALSHFFGYEGRCSLPSNFDATYCNALGQTAGCLVAAGQTGLMATVSNLDQPANKWSVGGTPLLSMMHLERRSGRDKPVIKKALVEIHGPAMTSYTSMRAIWAIQDWCRSPGPIQFKGHTSDMANISLALEVNEGHPCLVNEPTDKDN